MATIWKTYRGGPTKAPATVVNISINSKNVITLNRQAYELISRAESAVLLFDDKNSVIGIVPANHKNAEAFPVRPKNEGNWIINAAPFCRHFRISVDRTERFDDPQVDNEGILHLDLKRTHNVSLKRGRRQKADPSPNQYAGRSGGSVAELEPARDEQNAKQ